MIIKAVGCSFLIDFEQQDRVLAALVADCCPDCCVYHVQLPGTGFDIIDKGNKFIYLGNLKIVVIHRYQSSVSNVMLYYV